MSLKVVKRNQTELGRTITRSGVLQGASLGPLFHRPSKTLGQR